MRDVPIHKFARRTAILFDTTYLLALILLLGAPAMARDLVGSPSDVLAMPALYGLVFAHGLGWWLLGYERSYFLTHVAAGALWIVQLLQLVTLSSTAPSEVMLELVAWAVVLLVPALVVARWVWLSIWILRSPLFPGGPTLPAMAAEVRERAHASYRSVPPEVPGVGPALVLIAVVFLAVPVLQPLLPTPEEVGVSATASEQRALWLANLACVPFALGLLGFGLQLDQPDARRVLETSGQPPILLLRSFSDDRRAVTPRNLLMRLGTLFLHRRRLEAAIASEIQRMGPFVAIGAPGEALPRLGAARTYFDAAEWQDAVRDWMHRSQLVVTVAGTTEWVTWELAQLADNDLLDKVIVFFPPGSVADRRARFAPLLEALATTPWGPRLQELSVDDLLALRFVPGGGLTIVGSRRRPGEIDYEIALLIGVSSILEERPTLAGGEAPDVGPPQLPLSGDGRPLGARIGALGTLAVAASYALAWAAGSHADGSWAMLALAFGLALTVAAPLVAGFVALLRFDPSKVPEGLGGRFGRSAALRAAIPAAAIVGAAVTLTMPGLLVVSSLTMSGDLAGELATLAASGNVVTGVVFAFSVMAGATGVAATIAFGSFVGWLRVPRR